MKKIKISRNQAHEDLTNACREDDLEKIKTIVESGLNLAEPWLADSYPLMVTNSLEILGYLIEHGMPVYENKASLIKGLKRSSDVHLLPSLLNGKCTKYHEPNYEALSFLAMKTDKEYFIKGDDSIFSNDPFKLLYTLKNGLESERSEGYFNTLIERGASVDQHQFGTNSILHCALMESGNEFYIKKMIDVSKRIDQVIKDENGISSPIDTPMKKAIKAHLVFAVKKLIERGADVTLVDPYSQQSMLDWALRVRKKIPTIENEAFNRHRSEMDEIIKLLKDNGAKTYQQMLDDGDIQA